MGTQSGSPLLKTAKAIPVGIAADVVYPLPVFRAITGFSDSAMRTARRRGLIVRYVGGRAFVHGADFLDYLERSAKTTN